MPRAPRVWLWSIVAGLWLVLALPALAQSGSVRIDDAANRLGARAGEVQQAAERLAAEGAEVIVVVSEARFADDADEAIETLVGQIKPNQIIFFVAPEAEYTSLRYGQRWLERLDPVEARIQQQQMNPGFANGDLAGGMIAGIDAARTTINPPTSPAVYVVGGVAAAAAATAAAVPVMRRRRATADALGQARSRWEQARRAAGAAIADLGQLVRQAQDKAQYDQISYSQSDVQRVQELQGKGIAIFQDAQASFDAAEEQQNAKATLEPSDYTRIAAQYDEAQARAQQATELIREAEALRATLDARGTPSTGPTTRLGE